MARCACQLHHVDAWLMRGVLLCVAAGTATGAEASPQGAEAKAISAAKSDEQRNPNLPTSVPLPTSAAEVTNNEHMAAFFATAAKSSAPTEPQGV